MIIQLIIGTLGFYAIRTFEKWTVPVLATVMGVMTVLAFSKGRVVWNHSSVHGSGLIRAASELMTAAGIGWGFSWSAWASDYSRFTRPEVIEKRMYWVSRVRSRAPLTVSTSRGWRRSYSAGWRTGCCVDPSRISLPRLRLPPKMAERSWSRSV